MRIEVAVDIPLSADETRQLAGILGCKEPQLNDVLQSVASAALQEYVRMFLGQKVFTRGSDMLEYRLFLLMRELFNNTVPNEERVCSLFQATTSNARALIRSVLSKYQYELHDAFSGTIRSTLDSARRIEKDGDYEVTVNSQSVIDGLNRALAERDGTLPSIVKKRGTVCTYVIRPSAFKELRLAFPAGADRHG